MLLIFSSNNMIHTRSSSGRIGRNPVDTVNRAVFALQQRKLIMRILDSSPSEPELLYSLLVV